MNNIPDSERMLLDFDGWLGTQPEERQAQLRDYIDTNPDPAGAKRGIAARFAVAESTGIDPVEVDDKWDLVRGGFAAQKGGDWLSTVNDENAFHSRLVQEAQFRRDERQLIFGPDDEKAPDATDKRSLSLVKQVEDAAFSGGAFADAFAQWQGAAVVNKGWRADRHPAHETVAREVYDRTAATVAKVKPIAEEAFNRLAALRGVNDTGEKPIPFELFRGLSEDERGAAFRLISEKSKQQKGDKKWVQALGEGVGRGFENLLVGLALNPLTMNEVFAKKFKAGDEVFGVNVEDYLGGGTEQKSQNIKKAEGLAELASSAIFSEKRKLTEAEAEDWNEQLKNIREDLRTFEVLRKISTGEVDPTQNVGGFVFQKMVMPVADSTALIAGMATNPVATMAAATGQYSNENFQRLTEQGMDDAEALKIANVSGVAQAALDKLGFEFLRGVPAVNNALKKVALGGGAATRFALNAGTTLAAETAIELTQDQIIPALMQDLYSSNPAFDVNWSDVWRDAAKAAPETALGMVLLSAAGGAFQTFSDSQHTRMLSQSKAAMTLAGYTDAQIELIQQQPIAERGRLLAQFAPEKAPTGAEKDALIERYTKAEKAERAEYIEKLKAEAGDASDALDYAVRVTRRQGSGWTVTTESGKNLVVDSAEAARRIRQDLAQASSQREAETLVAMVEDWQSANPDAQRQTTFTGETATSDGISITYKRDGKITREITDEKTLETLRREAEIVASQTGGEAVNVIVNGSNQTFRTRVADAVSQVVQRLEINRSASSVLTFLHESMESNWRAGMQDGTLTRESTRKAVASIASAFNVNSTDAETRAFAERVQRVADGTATDDELRETVSELAVADVIGRRKDGGKFEIGSVSRAISDAIQRAADESAIAGLSKLQAFIRAAKTFFRGVLGTVAAIRKAKQKDGKLAEDWEAFMHELTGTSAQTQYDAGRVEDLNAQLAAANAASADYVPPTAEQEAAGIAFSVSRASDAEYLDAVRRGDMATAQRMVDAAARAAGYDVGPVWHGTRGDKFTVFDKSKIGTQTAMPYDAPRGFYFAKEEKLSERYGPTKIRAFVRGPFMLNNSKIAVVENENQIKSADPVTYDDAGNVIPLSQRFNEASNDIRFSLSPSAHVELLQRQVDTQLKRDPERRRKLAKAAGDKLQALQFAWETDRVNERGVKTRSIVEQRSPASLSKEQAFREAMRREELEAEVYAVYGDVLENESLGQLWGAGPVMEYLSNPTDRLHGRLMSKSQALKSGKFSESNGDYDGIDGIPRVVFGGSLMPDQVAQELFEAGILKDASVDALWDTIRDEIKSAARWKGFLKTAKEGLKKAKRQAHEEAAEWRREQDELQKEDWNPKARLLRDMRALDAVISVLPPELRSKVGGFIKLAELTTDKARMKEIEKRMKKLGGIVEDYLKKESIEAIDALIEKAQPSTGPGEKPKGKITVEGHRVFAAVEAVRGMTTEQVDAERARLATEIEKRITKGEDVIDLLEQEQILEMFGAIDEKTAAEADSAASWLDKVYRTGRNAWRMMEEARLAEVADLKEQTIAAIGAASKSGTQEQKKNAAKLKAFAESASFQLLSFTQVLESVVGAGHPLVKRWSRAAREATNQRTDAILGANARFEKAARDAFGGVSKLEMSRRLWAMSNDQRISLPVVEGGRSETLTVPIEKIRQFADGSVNPADLGYSPEEAADLIDQLNALPAKSRKKNLSVERILPGETKPAKYTEAEVMALTMLAKQAQYLPNLEKHGYTAAVIEAAEAALSDAAKAIRTHLLKEYADGYAPLAKVFREMFGIDLPSVANYSPAAFMHAGETRDVDPFGGMVAEGGFRAGFLKSRKEHLAAPRIENALQTFQGHVAQTEHWRAFAPLVRELRAVFGSVEVKDSILSNRGSGLANAAQSWISALEMNGLQQRAFMSALNPIFRYLTGKQATLTLAWKAGTLIKQSLAALSSAARLPSGVWLRGLSRVLSGKIDVSAIRNSPMIQRRLESGFSPEVRAAMVSLFNGKPSVWSQFVQAGMEKIGEVDAFFTSIGTAIAYDYHFNEGLKNGMSEEAAREMALVEAEDNLGRTAQPTELIDRSLYELGMSPAERVGFMFASNARKDAGLMISAFEQFRAGKISKAEFTQTIAITWLAVSFGNAILSAWWRDANDDDDEWLDWEHWSPVDIVKSTLTNPLGGLPLVGALYNTFSGYGPNDPFKPVKQMKSAVAGITDGDKSEPVEKTVRRVVDVLNGAAVFVPKLEGVAVGANIVEQAFNLADNLVPDTESEAAKKEKAAIARERKAAREAK